MNGRRKWLIASGTLAVAFVATPGIAAEATAASAQDGAQSVIVAQASRSMPPAMARREADGAFPPAQAGVRHAAEQGPTALRRYVHRTRMIYNYYYYDYAKLLPPQ